MFKNTITGFEEDPFFSGISKSMLPSSLMQLEPQKQQKGKRGKRSSQLENPFQSMMMNMNQMISNLHSNMEDIENDPNSHCYTSSAVMSYQKDGKSKPRCMQASSSVCRAPGRIRETRRTYRDSESGVEKMAVGHHIGSRGHEHEKKRIKDGDIQEEKRFYDLDEDELSDFESEWRRCTKSNKLENHQFDLDDSKRNIQSVEGPRSSKRRRKRS